MIRAGGMTARCLVALLAKSIEAPEWLPAFIASSPYLTLIFITLLPYIELRGSIPVGILGLGLEPGTVFAICTAVNVLLIPPIFLLLDFAFERVFRIPWFHRHIRGKVESVRRSSKRRIDRYGLLGLMAFVAIPLPGTGAYTGCLAAFLLDMERKTAGAAVALGVVVAGTLVTLASMGVFSAFKSLGLDYALGLVALAAAIILIALLRRRLKGPRDAL